MCLTHPRYLLLGKQHVGFHCLAYQMFTAHTFNDEYSELTASHTIHNRFDKLRSNTFTSGFTTTSSWYEKTCLHPIRILSVLILLHFQDSTIILYSLTMMQCCASRQVFWNGTCWFNIVYQRHDDGTEVLSMSQPNFNYPPVRACHASVMHVSCSSHEHWTVHLITCIWNASSQAICVEHMTYSRLESDWAETPDIYLRLSPCITAKQCFPSYNCMKSKQNSAV